MNFTWRLVAQWGPLFLAGLGQTVLVFTVATPLALFTGAVVALLATVPSRVVRMLCYVYTSLFRNSPLLVQLFFIFYGLPFVGVRLSPFLCGVLGITLNEGAFVAEILRGAIQAIPRGDWEAAASLGLSRFQVLRLVILPQAFRDAVPALTGQASIILKDTSVLSLIMITELTRVAGLLFNRTFDTIGHFVAAGMYIALFLIITWVSRLIELKFRVLR